MRVIKGPLGGTETVTLSTVVDGNKNNSSGEWSQTVLGMMRTSITMMNNVKIYVDLKEKRYRDGPPVNFSDNTKMPERRTLRTMRSSSPCYHPA